MSNFFNSSLLFLIAINLFLIIALLVGELAVFNSGKSARLSASYSLLIGVLFLLYIISIFFLIVESVLSADILHAGIFVVFMAMPFGIGKAACYKRIKLFALLQILTLVLSLCFLLWMFFTGTV